MTIFVTTHYMDEAERCHRVALMHAGKLLALDTIIELKQIFTPGLGSRGGLRRRAQGPGDPRRAAWGIDAALFGDHLHAVVESPVVAEEIKARLDAGGFAPVTVRPVPPSLEDVFIRSIREAEEAQVDVIRRVLATAVKEFLQLKRDWRTALALLGMPIVLLMIYGYALSFDVTDIRLGVVDQSRTRASRQLVEAFLKSGFFLFKGGRRNSRLGHSTASSLTRPSRWRWSYPPTSPRRFRRRRPTSILFVLDGSDSQTANTVLGYARQIVASQTGSVYGIEVEAAYQVDPLVWYNPDLKSSIFLIPGLLAFILMVSSVIATSLAIVREKERGTDGVPAGHTHPRHRTLAGQGFPLPYHRFRRCRGFSLPRLVSVRRPHPGLPCVAGGSHPALSRRRARGGASLFRPSQRPSSWLFS